MKTTNDIFYSLEIESRIRKLFPDIKPYIHYDPDQDEYIVGINDRSVYYSDSFQNLVLDLQVSLLWRDNKNNFLFVLEDHQCCVDLYSDVEVKVSNGELLWSVSNLSDENHSEEPQPASALGSYGCLTSGKINWANLYYKSSSGDYDYSEASNLAA